MSKGASFVKDKEGNIVPNRIPKGTNKIYLDATIRYLNDLEPLFEKAKEKNEVQFIITLLRFRGVESEGWDTYENSLRVYDAIHKTIEKSKDSDLRINLSLWLYGHIVEASEPYEIIANLLSICSNGSFVGDNFPKEKQGSRYCDIYPAEKIKRLEQKASLLGMQDVVRPIKEIYNRELRNAIFHSDYAVHENGVRLRNPDVEYSPENVSEIINKACAYHDVIKNLLKSARKFYTEPKIINDASSISDDPDCKITVIVRKGYGVIGFRDSWTDEEIKFGKIPFYMGKTYRYEKKYINRRMTLLPRSRIELYNKILKLFPRFLAIYLVKFFKKRIG